MKKLYKLIILLLLAPSVLLANEDIGKYTQSKKIHKEFSISKNGKFKIVNKYGNINIHTWNENRIVIDVYIETNGNNEQKVLDKLKQISVNFDHDISYVYAKTIIEKSNYSNWSFFKSTNSIGMKINYTIKIPMTNTVEIHNDYGQITIDKILGKTKINCNYGSLFIGDLLNSENIINIDYNEKSTIEYLKGGTINSNYTTLEIEKSNKLRINADYSHIQIGSVNHLTYNCDYGNLNVENIGSIKGNSDYFHIKIKNLTDNATLSNEYGSIKINNILNGFSEVKIDSEYGNIKLGISENTPYTIKANIEYGSFKFDPSNFTFHKKNTRNSSKYYEGYYLKENHNARINLQTSYGSVTITNH